MVIIERLTEVTEETITDINELYTFLSGTDDERRATLASLREMLDHGYMVTAHDGSKIVGMASLFILKRPRGFSATVEDVVVHGDYRSQGIGGRLMQAVVDIAKENKVKSLRLTSTFSRIASHRLYEKVGFRRKDSYAYCMML